MKSFRWGFSVPLLFALLQGACAPFHTVREVRATCEAPRECVSERDSCLAHVRQCGLGKNPDERFQCETSYQACLERSPGCKITQQAEEESSALGIAWNIIISPFALLALIGSQGLAYGILCDI